MNVSLRMRPGANKNEAEHLALVRQVLEAFQHEGDYQLDILSQITWRAANKVIQFIRVTDDNGVEVKLKPGDNSTCWSAKICVPNGVSAKQLGEEICSLANWNGKTPIGVFEKRKEEQRPIDPLQPITAKLQRLRETAASHMALRQRITELQKSAEEHFAAAEAAETSAKELERQLAGDHAGRGAYEALQAVHDLLHVSEE